MDKKQNHTICELRIWKTKAESESGGAVITYKTKAAALQAVRGAIATVGCNNASLIACNPAYYLLLCASQLESLIMCKGGFREYTEISLTEDNVIVMRTENSVSGDEERYIYPTVPQYAL